MKVSVLDRVVLLGILPENFEGNYLTFKILTALKLALSFSEEDYKNFNLRQEDGKIFWDKSEDKEIEIGEKALEIIRESMKRLDEAGKINAHNVSVYEKFMNF